MRPALLAAIALCTIAGSASAAEPACDRACLEGFVNQYLAALAAGDPGKLPLAKNARYIENGQELKLGDGMWGVTVTLGHYELYFADPQAGRVGYFGTIQENGHPVILGLRLKIECPKISEMEVLALRKTTGVFSEPQNLSDKPIFHQALAPSQRRPRAELIRVANSDFAGMEAGTDQNTPFDKNCQRIENEVITSNDPSSKSEITRLSCGAQFATGFTRVITRVPERRLPVVDEERGIVQAAVRFDHSGHNKTITWNDGTVHKVNPPFDQPYSFFIDELFKIVDRKANRIEALVTPVPYGMYTGWPSTSRR